MVLVPSFQFQKQKDSFLGLGCCVSYRPVWSSENVAQKEKRKISGPGVPPEAAMFVGLAVLCMSTSQAPQIENQLHWIKLKISFIGSNVFGFQGHGIGACHSPS
jgi:hypothetical protein